MIKDISHVPNKPGVYQFFDENKIIYIGKGKDLKKRVSSYFTKSIKDRKTEQIKKLAVRVETFTTHSEAEALILEQQLIKEYKPRFNILLKDDKTYPYIYFDGKNTYPSIKLKRLKNLRGVNYFGPFSSAKMARDQIKNIQKIYKIRNCSDSTFYNRSRPCIEYQMKRCSAPCVNFISETDYQDDINHAKEYLISEKKQLKTIYLSKMEAHAEKLEFEKAEDYKRRIKAIKALEDESNISTSVINLDIIHATFENHKTGIALISVRDGKTQSTKTYFFNSDKYNEIELLFQRVIFHYYQTINQLPRKILLLNKIKSVDLIAAAIRRKFNKSVRFIKRTSDDSKPFVALAKLNSKQAIENNSLKKPYLQNAFDELRKTFKLDQTNLTLECIDISHFSGKFALASIVHFAPEGPNKSLYRTYNIPSELAGNDVGSIQFAVSKRLHPKNDSPTILLIDGGMHQLKAALEAMNSHRTLLLAIKKGKGRKQLAETILSEFGIESIQTSSALFNLFIKARNEAHRFAIKKLRDRNLKSIDSSILDKISGIGPTKKKILLREFRNIKEIIKIDVQDLKNIPGISEPLARRIKLYLRSNWRNS